MTIQAVLMDIALRAQQLHWPDWCDAGVAPVQVEARVNRSLEIMRKEVAILSYNFSAKIWEKMQRGLCSEEPPPTISWPVAKLARIW